MSSEAQGRVTGPWGTPANNNLCQAVTQSEVSEAHSSAHSPPAYTHPHTLPFTTHTLLLPHKRIEKKQAVMINRHNNLSALQSESTVHNFFSI